MYLGVKRAVPVYQHHRNKTITDLNKIVNPSKSQSEKDVNSEGTADLPLYQTHALMTESALMAQSRFQKPYKRSAGGALPERRSTIKKSG